MNVDKVSCEPFSKADETKKLKKTIFIDTTKTNFADLERILSCSKIIKELFIFSNENYLNYKNQYKKEVEKSILKFLARECNKTDLKVEQKEIFISLETENDRDSDEKENYHYKTLESLIVNEINSKKKKDKKKHKENEPFSSKDKKSNKETHDIDKEYKTSRKQSSSSTLNNLIESYSFIKEPEDIFQNKELYLKVNKSKNYQNTFEANYDLYFRPNFIIEEAKKNIKKEEEKKCNFFDIDDRNKNSRKEKEEEDDLLGNDSDEFLCLSEEENLKEKEDENLQMHFEDKIKNTNIFNLREDIKLFNINCNLRKFNGNCTIFSIEINPFISSDNFLTLFKTQIVLPSFEMIKDIADLTAYIPVYSSEETILIFSYKQKIFELITNFKNISVLNPSVKSLKINKKTPNNDSVKNILCLEINKDRNYEIEIKECMQSTEYLNTLKSPDWIFSYYSRNVENSLEDHIVTYQIKTVKKDLCLVTLNFDFPKKIDKEVFKSIKKQQIGNLILLKKYLEVGNKK